MEWVEQINTRARAPDLTLFLEIDVRTAARRRAARGGEPELFDADQRQAQIAQRYLEAIRRRPRSERIVRIDGTLSKEEVTRTALEAIARVLRPAGAPRAARGGRRRA
jgi:dTMP kinase